MSSRAENDLRREVPAGRPYLAPDGNVFNGIYTISGAFGHRTLSIETQKKDDEFAPGERIMYLLTGENNTDPKSWTGFAFVKMARPAVGGFPQPHLYVWKRFQTKAGTPRSSCEVIGDMLLTMLKTGHRAFVSGVDGKRHEYRLQLTATCSRCNRLLTTPESIERGIGPDCSQRD